MRIVWLKGDYARDNHHPYPHPHEREEQATREGCNLVVEFHFNSNNSASAKGGEVYFKPGSKRSRDIVEAMVTVYTEVGLPLHGTEPVIEATNDTRASWLRNYTCPTVLLEPLFVSNPIQSTWLHNATNMQRLADGVADKITQLMPQNSVIGLSVGHLYKNSNPNDKGATCRQGDTEAAHGCRMASLVGQRLGANLPANLCDDSQFTIYRR